MRIDDDLKHNLYKQNEIKIDFTKKIVSENESEENPKWNDLSGSMNSKYEY